MEHTSPIKVFIASGNDLITEREETIQVFHQLKKAPHFLDLEASKWETDLPSGSYNKKQIQDEISPLLENCPVVIVLFYSKTGKFTLEEYQLALKLNKKVFLYFKKGFTPDNKKESTALNKVFTFKKKVEKENQTLFQVFTSIADFREKLTRDLSLYFTQDFEKEILLKGSRQYHDKLRGPNGRFKNLQISNLILPGTKQQWLDTPVSIQGASSQKTTTVPEAISLLWQQTIKHAVIVGAGGMGKTVSLLLWWQQLLNNTDKNKPIPIYIALNEVNQVPPGQRNNFILSYIRQHYTHNTIAISGLETILAKTTNAPSYILLLDGFNEITVEKHDLLVELKHLRESCPGLQIVLTSRNDMREVHQWLDWNLVLLLPLTDSQINAVLPKTKELQPTLKKLLQNPMMLTLYAASCEIQTNLKDSTVYDFKKSVESTAELLWNFIEAQVVKLPERLGEQQSQVVYYQFLLQFMLPAIGLEMEKAGLFDFTRQQMFDVLDRIGQEFSNPDFFRVFPQFIKHRKSLPLGSCADELESMERATVITEQLCKELCLMVEEGDSYRFLHQDFRDFFAAAALSQQIQVGLKKQELPAGLKDQTLSIFVRRMLGELEGEFRVQPFLNDNQEWCININENTLLHRVLTLCRGKFGQRDREVVGYTVWNIVTIWKELRGELSGENLSGLDLTGILLNGVRCSRFYESGYLTANFNGSRLHEHNLFPQGHFSYVNSAVYSPDGQKILSASSDKTIKEWDIATGTCLQTLTGHSKRVTSVVYSPDGQKILSASFDKTIKEWDVATGLCVATLTGHSKRVTSALYSPDSQKILSASWDKTIKEWDVVKGTCLKTLTGHSKRVFSAVYSPDGQKILSASYDYTIKEWDVATGTCLKTLTGHSSYVKSAVYSPDGKKVLSASYDFTIKEWDVATGTCLKTLTGHSSGVTRAVYNSDGKKILSASFDKTIKEWDVATDLCVATLTGHSKRVFSAVYSPDGKKILSASDDHTIKAWDVATGTCLQTLTGHSHWVKSALYSPDGKKILSASFDKTIKEWDVATGTCLQTLTGHSASVNTAVYSPDGQKILSASWDETIKEWDVATGTCVQTITGHSASVNTAVYSPDGQKILSASDDYTIKEWDVATGTCVATLTGHSKRVFSAVYSPDGPKILSASFDKTIKEWDVATGTCVATLTGHANRVTRAVYNFDGKKVLSASFDKTIKEWDVATGTCVQTYNSDDHPTIPGYPDSDTTRQLEKYSNFFVIENPQDKTKIKVLINIPGLWIQGCSFLNLEPGSQWTKESLEILEMYSGFKIKKKPTN